MHIRLLAVGDRQPGWVDAAFIEYAARLPRQWQFRLHAITAAQRAKAASGGDARVAEGEKILAKLKPAEFVVVLDEHGTQFSSAELATKIGDWQTVGQDVAFVIGGPDGLAAEAIGRADLRLAFGAMTWPHQLVRIMLAEQLYRTVTILAGHPYHRD
jgi:23S rRNA (pseudouridine1915-N3)-methyltransferase